MLPGAIENALRNQLQLLDKINNDAYLFHLESDSDTFAPECHVKICVLYTRLSIPIQYVLLLKHLKFPFSLHCILPLFWAVVFGIVLLDQIL